MRFPRVLAASMLCVCALASAACGPTATPMERLAEEQWLALRKGPDPRIYTGFVSYNEAAAKEHGFAEDAKGIEFQIRYIQATAEAAEATTDVALAQRALDVIQRIRSKDRVSLYEQFVPGFTARLEDAERRIVPILR